MRAPEVVTTARMRGEAAGARHLDALAPIFGDPRVGATMGGVMSREVVAQMLAGNEREWARDGFSSWMFFETATGQPLARGGVRRTEFDGRPEVEVGWTTAPDRWGEGFATELGNLSIQVAAEHLRLEDIVAFTLPENGASRRVMEKLGFRYEKTAPYKHFGDHVLYRLNV
ncbi:GNAT family N-acetyltransferase [Solirubrobacter phytolaccae]|uniref:GNAT family N-acetyltransferase n=1 Tax=Solirubrobacter phytolaccae TaxID=1404360 RepID=A0A9X3NEL4_9ACTN|nr:GNAT family N-acetyltransferase [Solirubrobacter phytolaccae]MDA0183495.1 GNAT family N-acetyltransferase [Solirubrobacter phytolaccae]